MPACANFVLSDELKYSISIAKEKDAAAIATLRNATAQHLTEIFGEGFWSHHSTEKGVLWGMRRGQVVIARSGRRIIGTMTIGTRKPWAIDPAYFAKSRKPFYITDMAVTPDLQRTGVGRALLDEARSMAQKNGGDALRLDAWDAKAGAGSFYAKCGFKEVGHVTYRSAPLVYYELSLA